MYLSGIENESLVDGPGIRVAIFISGCHHACPECHNPETWDFKYGHTYTEEDTNHIIELCKNPLIDGITLSGGDPFYSAGELIPIVKQFRKIFPDKNVWAFTGFLWEQLMKHPDMQRLASLCDVIVDGPFIIARKDFTQSFRGSYNQRFIDVKKTLNNGKIVEWKDDF